MSVAAYSTCRIQFIPNDRQRSEKDYSDRSLIELRQYDFADYSLRALDIENNKQEIFNIPFKKEEQYKRGQTANQPDEIHSTNGNYRFWLNAASRAKFHEALTTCIEQLKFLVPASPEPQPRSASPPPATRPKENRRENSDLERNDDQSSRVQPRRRSPSPPPATKTKENRRQNSDLERNDDQSSRVQPRRRSPSPPPATKTKESLQKTSNSREHDDRRNDNDQLSRTPPNRNDILVDIHELGHHIRKGDANEAIDLSKKLAKQRVQLQANPCTEQSNEKIIQIRVKIDSNDQKISNKETIIEMGVYPSTTVCELRAAFEYSEKFPPSSQYFFVNGHLAHENSTMKELNIGRNSLFVLFIVQQ